MSLKLNGISLKSSHWSTLQGLARTAALYYLFDPLCGWCYGAVPALIELKAADVAIRLIPTGIFSGPGARAMDDDFANFAWTNDQRIHRISGQPFTEQYRAVVLADRQQRCDSGPASLALTAVAMTSSAQEMTALEAIQRARFVDGRNVTDGPTLCAILTETGLPDAADALAQPSQALSDAHHRRAAEAMALIREFRAQGVPTFIAVSPTRRWLLDASGIYAEPHVLLRQLQAP